MLHEGESQRSSMTRRLLAPILPLLLGLVLLGVTTGPVLTSYTDAPVVSPTEGRQGLDDQIAEECGELTFEDLFVYDFALFELKVHDDWSTGEMNANAWVNGSNAATVRDNLDGLFDGTPVATTRGSAPTNGRPCETLDRNASVLWTHDSACGKAYLTPEALTGTTLNSSKKASDWMR